MTNVPAATRALAMLRTLAAAPGPMAAPAIARELRLPRSSTYHLLAALEADGFVVHYPEEGRWGLGIGAFEIGSGYLRHDPLERQARPLLRALVQRLAGPAIAHCGVLHGRETLYIATEATAHPVSSVAEVGVRLPASLTASGRAMLARLPAAQIRALFPERGAFVDRTGRGPTSLTSLRELLASESAAGVSVEEGMVLEGYSSIAASAVDRSGRPLASIGVTVPREAIAVRDRSVLASAVCRTADELTRRLGGQRALHEPTGQR